MQMMKKLLSVLLALLFVIPALASLSVTVSAMDFQLGDFIQFGSYPQSEVKDSELVAALNEQSVAWQSYGYYSGDSEKLYQDSAGTMTAKDYMQYADVTYDGEMYRGVRFVQYRPGLTGCVSSAARTAQDENGYYIGTTYWFLWEPLRWHVLNPDTGLVLCESIIDAQAYNNYRKTSGQVDAFNADWADADCTYYTNDYEKSDLRAWLTDASNAGSFLNMAFTSTQRDYIYPTDLDNSAYDRRVSVFDSASTTDKVFLLSWDDALDPVYGFSINPKNENPARQTKGTDYAKCQGLAVNNNTSYWRLRTAGNGCRYACYVNFRGTVENQTLTERTDCGIRPAMCIDLEYAYVTAVYKAKFVADGKLVDTVSYKAETTSIKDKEPAVPPKTGYTAAWEPYTPNIGGVTVNAVYTPIPYTATFVADGTKVGEVSYTVETESIADQEPDVPEKPGYTGAWKPYSLLLGGVTVEAEYTLVGFVAKFIADGTTVGTVEYDANTTSIKDKEPAVPPKTGYTGAWKPYTLQIGGVTVEAEYTCIPYTIRYELNGGTAENPTAYNVETATFTLHNPTRTGYTFTGWSGTDLTGDANKAVTIAQGSTGDRDFAAHWTLDTYKITCDLDGGTVTTANPTSYTVETPDFTLTNPTKTGCTFKGWTGTGLSYPAMTVTIAKGSTGDRSYKATYAVNNYSVTVQTDGHGTARADKTTNVPFGTTVTLTATPHTGYTFDAWTGYAVGADNTFPMPDSNVTVKATFKTIPYTIRYELNGGTLAAENPTTYTVETATFTLHNPTKTGYTFKGWTGTGLSTPATAATVTRGSTGDRSYTANWTAETYKITYDLDGGKVASANPATYTFETTSFTLNNPTRTGYTFKGWTGTDLSAVSMTVTIAKGSTGDRSYTANWTLDTYTITYDLNGGTVAAANPTSYTCETATFTLHNPSRTGYTFKGWTGSNGATAQTTVMIAKGSAGDKNYTANWTLDTYTITYDLDGGKAASANPTSYTFETATFTLTNPTKTGSTFAGWTGTGLSAATKTVTIAKGSTGDRSYTANWTFEAYTIVYDLDGGTLTEANPTGYSFDTPTFTLHNPIRTGYTFKGWSGTDLSGGENKKVTIPKGSTGDRSYTANWTLDTYTIAYELNGGTLTEANPTSYSFETETFTLREPIRTGYTFKGWTGSNGTAPQTTVTIPKGSTGSKSFAANWTLDTYAIAYELNGGTVTAANPTSYTCETAAFTLTNPTKVGCTFAGWTGTGLSGAAMTVTIAQGSTGDRSYTATYTINPHTVTVQTDGRGTADADKTTDVAYGTTVTLTAAPDAGYAFDAWTGFAVSADNTFTMPDSDVTVKATFRTIPYTIAYELDGGTVTAANPTSYDVETASFTLTNPTKVGYVFAGWTGTDLSDAAMTVTIAQGSTGDRSYTATWALDTYTITYELDGGTLAAANPTSYTIETPDFTLTNPTKSGCTFKGWTGSNGATAQTTVTIAQGSTGDKSFAANWTLDTYTISYDLNGGTLAAANPTGYSVDTATFTLTNPTKVGYTFAGWTGTDLSAATVTVTIAKGSTGDRSYTATWTLDTYTITYDLDGGTVAAVNPTSYTIETPDFTLANPTKAGCTFTGWTGTGLSAATAAVTIAKGSTGERTYTATYALNRHRVTVQTDGHGIAVADQTADVAYGATVTLTATPNAGYAFDAWAGYSVAADNTFTMPDSDVTVKATFKMIPFTITYDLSGGTLAAANPTSYTVETETFTLKNPTKTGYTFKGWIGSNGSTPQTTVTIVKGSTGNKSFTAQYEKAVITSLRIVKLPSKTVYTYRRDKTVDLRGMELEATYSDGTTKTIKDAAGCKVSGYSAKPRGDKTVIVEYEGKTVQFNVNVKYVWWQWIILILLFGWIWY